LTWTHFRTLCQIEDDGQRRALTREAEKEGWNDADLDARVRQINFVAGPSNSSAAPKGKTDLLTARRGTPGLHLIVDRGDGLAVDLGFWLYWPLTAEQAKRFSKGDIVRIASDDSLRRADDATKADLFTYAATLRRVVDGDTLVVALEVSPGVFIEQKLRLRGIDCPEMATPEGRAAKRFVETLLAKTTGVTIHTTEPDKYDRYLAEVFFKRAKGEGPEAKGEEEIFLNNALLENGHAVRYDGGAKEEGAEN
jgi:endonuclease YncB( thermonuclease family)